MPTKNKRAIRLVLLSCSFLICIISCSTVKDILSWPKSIHSGNAQNGFEDKEVARFVSTIRPYQGNPDSHYLLACYYQERGRHKEAIAEFERVLAIDPKHFKAMNGLGVSFDLLRDFPKAVESYEAALALNPDLDYVHNNLGYSLFLQGKHDEAMAAFKKAILVNDRPNLIHNNLGLAYFENGQFDLAFMEFKSGGDEAKAHFHLAELYFKKGLYKEAQTHYKIALSLNPSYTVAQTAFRAADTLGRIFGPARGEVEAKRLMISVPSNTGNVSTGKNGILDRLAAAKESESNLELNDNKEGSATFSQPPASENGRVFYEIQLAAFLSPLKAASGAKSLQKAGYQTDVRYWRGKGNEWYRLIVGPHTTLDEAVAMKEKIEKEYHFKNSIINKEGSATFSQPPASENVGVFYEIQLAAFLSPLKAVSGAKSLREAGYQTDVRCWRGKGNEWYRLIVGPHTTLDEAVAMKEKIEKEYHFKNSIIQSAAGDGNSKATVIQNRQIVFYEKLSQRGLNVKRLTNSSKFNHGYTKIYYQSLLRNS